MMKSTRRRQKARFLLCFYWSLLLSCNSCDWIVAVSSEPTTNGDDLDRDRLVNDLELLNAMELFMGMSADEREDTIQGLLKAVGEDPTKKAEMETLIQMLPQLDDTSTLQQMIQDDTMAKAKRTARQQLDGTDWESFWAMQEQILEATLASGQISPKDAARFKTDEEAWKDQLRIIFDDLQQNDREEL